MASSLLVPNITVEVIIGVLSVIGNGVVLYLIIRNSQLRTVTNCLIGMFSLSRVFPKIDNLAAILELY